MGKDILLFGSIQIGKCKFCRHNSTIFEKDLDIEKVLVSNKISSGEKSYKYFIGYLEDYLNIELVWFFDDYKVKPLYMMLLKLS